MKYRYGLNIRKRFVVSSEFNKICFSYAIQAVYTQKITLTNLYPFRARLFAVDDQLTSDTSCSVISVYT